MSDPSRFYRLLLRFYPARFREEYAASLELQFRDDYLYIHGVRAHMFFWMRALRDLVISIPREILHEVTQDFRVSVGVYRRRPLVTGLAVIALAMAIGASPGKIRSLMVCQSMIPVIAGLAAGVAGAIASAEFLKSLMESAEPLGAQTCILGGLLLVTTALAAVWAATSRVIQLDPMIAPRSE
jgi:hypothetical protein